LTNVSSAAPGRSQNAAWLTLSVISVIAALNYLDRFLMAAVLPLIKQDFEISDTQLGLLSIAFAILYAGLGLPMGRLVDKHSRRMIIGVTTAVWSVATAACGVATSFWTLFTARMGVALGESGFMPASYSLLADNFPPAQRNFAAGLLTGASSLGVVAGLALGGWLGSEYGWRFAFLAVGLPGILIALAAYWILREPKRGATDEGGSPDATEHPSMFSAIRALCKDPIFVWISITSGLNAFASIGMVQWLPSFFHRTHDLPLDRIGFLFGVAFGVGLCLGQILGGAIGSAWGARRRFKPLLLCVIANAAVVPASLAMLWVPDAGAAIALTLVATFVGSLGHAAQGAGVQNAVPTRLRGMGHATLTVMVSVIGMGIGPFVVGALSDMLTPRYGDEGLRWALTGSLALLATAAVTGYLAYRAGQIRDRTTSPVQSGV
jgi:predicted MFS family arabinose efflux permease